MEAKPEVNIGQAVQSANVKTREKARKYGPNEIPVDLAPRWEMIVRESAKALKDKRDKIKVAIGEKPYNSLPIDEDEAVTRYLQMRNDPELHSEALSTNIKKSKDGRILIKKDYLKAITDIENKIRKGVINV
jgi:hypothetical protein